MKRPIILHVVATLDRGGTEVSCLALAGELARRGYGNRVVALRRGAGEISEALAAVAGEPAVLPAGRLARAVAFQKLVRRLAPDAVILHIFNSEHVTLGLAARAAGVNRLAAKLGNPVPDRPSVRRKLAAILRLTKLTGVRIVSASRWIESSLRDTGRLPSSAVVVHNGCNVETIALRAGAARTARDGREAVIGMVARLDPIKDHTTLLAAFAKLPEVVNGRPTRLILVGDGPLRKTLEAEAARLGIAGRATFTGARTDVPEALGQFDVFALSTTRDEGFGVVLIEAMSAGTPVVASDVPACQEVLQGGNLGRLVPQGDADALATALSEALDAPADVPPLTEVSRRYSVATMADGYLEVLFGHGPAHSEVDRRAVPTS